jgi:hypothetical protein
VPPSTSKVTVLSVSPGAKVTVPAGKAPPAKSSARAGGSSAPSALATLQLTLCVCVVPPLKKALR